MANTHKTLEDLSPNGGGLQPAEAVAILNDRPYGKITIDDAVDQLIDMTSKYKARMSAPETRRINGPMEMK